ncbi:MAG: DUF6152 family protein [Polyangiaceae bacterium]
MNSSNRRSLAAVIMVLGVLPATSGLAHHSMAMFDKERKQQITGNLYAVEWKSPHSWIWIAVEDKKSKGKTEIWGLEGSSPAALMRLGYTKKNLTVGTRVTATLYPLKDGRTGGSLVELDFKDGPKLAK